MMLSRRIQQYAALGGFSDRVSLPPADPGAGRRYGRRTGAGRPSKSFGRAWIALGTEARRSLSIPCSRIRRSQRNSEPEGPLSCDRPGTVRSRHPSSSPSVVRQPPSPDSRRLARGPAPTTVCLIGGPPGRSQPIRKEAQRVRIDAVDRLQRRPAQGRRLPGGPLAADDPAVGPGHHRPGVVRLGLCRGTNRPGSTGSPWPRATRDAAGRTGASVCLRHVTRRGLLRTSFRPLPRTSRAIDSCR